MKSYFTFIKNSRFHTALATAVLTVLFTGVSVFGATTISTNISTGGTLSVTGASTLTGNVTAAGTLAVTGATTLTGLTTMGYASTTGISLTPGAGTNALSIGGMATITTAGVFTSSAVSASTMPFASTTAVTSTTASTTNLIVGGNSTNGTFAGMIMGTCDIVSSSITASTTQGLQCTSATGVSSAYKVFVTATSSLATHLSNEWMGFNIVAASSTANDIIGVQIANHTGANNTVAGTLNFWAVR